MSDENLRPWEVMEWWPEFDGGPWVQIVGQRVRLPNGAVLTRHLVGEQREAVTVVPITAAGKVVLVREYKHGIGREVWGFPAGYLEAPTENPLDCARRELREETGYVAGSWLALPVLFREPNRGRSLVNHYLARGCTCEHQPTPDETEDLRAAEFEVADVDAMLRDGRMPALHCAAAWAVARWLVEH